MINNIHFNEKTVWIMYSSEKSDPYFSKFITNKTIVPAVCVIGNKEKFLIVNNLDYGNVESFKGTVLTYKGENSLIENIYKALSQMNYPEVIHLNYSDRLDPHTDVLGYGACRFLKDNILKLYENSYRLNPIFKSADELLYSLIDRKSEDDIKYMQLAANRTVNILHLAFQKIKVGMTEQKIANIVHQIFKIKPSYFKNHGILSEEYSWEKELCPIVLVGPNLKKGGHASPSNTVLKPGFTIYFDFGVKLCLADGRKYSSDIQRMGYALKLHETQAPENINNIFKTLVHAIKLGIENLKPSAKGYEIDEIVRNYIKNKGYPDYNHATGHPIGELTHSSGTSISPRGNKRSELFLQEGGVYTIEPRIQTENGGSIEEMIRVTKNGGIPLCPPQTKLYLIK